MATKVENFPSTDICLGYQVGLTLSASTSLSAPTFAKWMRIGAQVGQLRYRCDGVAPTVSAGMLLASGQNIAIGMADFTKFRAIQVDSGALATIEYWGYEEA